MIEVQALARSVVHHVERDHHRQAELAQFEREFQMALERRGVHHLDDHIRRRERRWRSARLVRRNRRALVAPQQVLQGHALFSRQTV